MDFRAENLDARLRTPRTAVYYLAFICLGLVEASLGPTLPWLAARAKMGVGAAGVFFAVRAGGYAVGSLVTGRLYDRAPGHWLMAAGMATMALAMWAIPGLSDARALGAMMLVGGAGAATLDVGGNTLLAWIHGDRVGPYMNGLHLFFGIGALASPMLVAQMFARGVEPERAYWVTAIALGLAALAVLSVESPAVRVRSRSAGIPSAGHERKHESERKHGQNHDHERDWLFVALVAAGLAAYVGIEVGFGGWAFTYGVEKAGMAKADGAYFTSAYWAAFTTGRLVSIPVLAWLGRWNERLGAARAVVRSLRQMLVGSIAGAAIAIGVLWMSGRATGGGVHGGGAIGGVHGGVAIGGVLGGGAAGGVLSGGSLVWVGAALLGCTIAPVFPALISLAEARAKLSGAMTAALLIGAAFGGMAIPWAVGVAMQRFGAATLIPALGMNLAVLALLVGALTPWLGRVRREVARSRPRAAL